MAINHITLMGTIARGPEQRVTPNGVPTTSISLAVTRPARQEGGAEVTDYVRVVAWRTLAERLTEKVQKGDLVVVEGRLTARSYETNDGQRRKTVEVEASSVEPVRLGGSAPAPARGGGSNFAEPSFEDDDFADFGNPSPAPTRAASAPARKPAPAPQPPADLDDEIPF